METVIILGNNVPVMGDKLGVFVSAGEVVLDGLQSRFDLYLQSWDGIYKVCSIDRSYRATVSTVGGFTHTVSLHHGRQLAAFYKGA